MSAEAPGSGEQGVEELRAETDRLDEALAALALREAQLEEELADEQRWLADLNHEITTAERGRRGAGVWAPVRLFLAFLKWLGNGGLAVVGVGVALLFVFALVFTESEPERPVSDGLVGVGSVILASPGSVPIGAPCSVDVGPAVRGSCRFAIACAEWRYEEEQPCWQGSYEKDTGEGGTATYYYLIARSSEDADQKFGFDEHEMLVALVSEPGSATIVLHTLEGRGRIK